MSAAPVASTASHQDVLRRARRPRFLTLVRKDLHLAQPIFTPALALLGCVVLGLIAAPLGEWAVQFVDASARESWSDRAASATPLACVGLLLIAPLIGCFLALGDFNRGARLLDAAQPTSTRMRVLSKLTAGTALITLWWLACLVLATGDMSPHPRRTDAGAVLLGTALLLQCWGAAMARFTPRIPLACTLALTIPVGLFAATSAAVRAALPFLNEALWWLVGVEPAWSPGLDSTRIGAAPLWVALHQLNRSWGAMDGIVQFLDTPWNSLPPSLIVLLTGFIGTWSARRVLAGATRPSHRPGRAALTMILSWLLLLVSVPLVLTVSAAVGVLNTRDPDLGIARAHQAERAKLLASAPDQLMAQAHETQASLAEMRREWEEQFLGPQDPTSARMSWIGELDQFAEPYEKTLGWAVRVSPGGPRIYVAQRMPIIVALADRIERNPKEFASLLADASADRSRSVPERWFFAALQGPLAEAQFGVQLLSEGTDARGTLLATRLLADLVRAPGLPRSPGLPMRVVGAPVHPWHERDATLSRSDALVALALLRQAIHDTNAYRRTTDFTWIPSIDDDQIDAAERVIRCPMTAVADELERLQAHVTGEQPHGFTDPREQPGWPPEVIARLRKPLAELLDPAESDPACFGPCDEPCTRPRETAR